MENYKQQIGSKRRSFLMLWTITLAVILLVGGFFFIPSAKYVFSGPITADYNSIYEFGLAPEKVHYVVPIEDDSNFIFQTVYMEDDIITEYFVGLINDEGYFVLAELSAADFESEDLVEFKGYFASLDDEVKEAIIEDLMAEGFTIDEAEELMPTNIFRVKDQKIQTLLLFIGLVLVGILFILTLVKWLTFNLDHYLAKHLSKYGDADQMGKALEMTPINFQHPDVAFTANHIIISQSTGIKAVKNDELLWAYKFIQKRKSLFVITVSKTVSLVLNTTSESRNFNMPEREVDAALEALAIKMPWVVCTFSEDLKKMYKKDRDGFKQMVTQQKNELDLEQDSTY